MRYHVIPLKLSYNHVYADTKCWLRFHVTLIYCFRFYQNNCFFLFSRAPLTSPSCSSLRPHLGNNDGVIRQKLISLYSATVAHSPAKCAGVCESFKCNSFGLNYFCITPKLSRSFQESAPHFPNTTNKRCLPNSFDQEFYCGTFTGRR